MSEYQNNQYENREQPVYSSGCNTPNGSASSGNPSGYTTPGYGASPAPHHAPKRSGGKGARIAKKVGALVLSGLLFGSVAGASMVSIQYMAGSGSPKDTAQSTQAADATVTETPAAGLTKTTAVANTSSGNLDVTAIAQSVMPSIVSITNKSVQEVQNYFSMFGFGGQIQQQEIESCGSGIVIGKNETELLIVTNYHVIENANTLSATFIDSQTYEAKMKGTDPENDLAVIAIPLESISADTMSQLAIATVGDSDALKVGQQVVAIGNALGYGQSVTTGIVSATDRSINEKKVNTSSQSEEVPTYIQTDAAINPGNSGGALVNMNGEVIGINSAKLASTEIEGMGYAIPISRVSDIIETLMNETTRSKVTQAQRSSIGISGITVDEAVNQAYGIPEGVFIAEVTEGGAAKAAGILKGEVITKFDGKKVTDINELKELLTYYSAGETVNVTVLTPGSNGYTERTVSVTLGKAAAAEQTDDGSATQDGQAVPTFPQFGNGK